MWILRALAVTVTLALAACNDCSTANVPHCPNVCGGAAQCVDGQWQCQLSCGADSSVAAPPDLRPMSHAD